MAARRWRPEECAKTNAQSVLTTAHLLDEAKMAARSRFFRRASCIVQPDQHARYRVWALDVASPRPPHMFTSSWAVNADVPFKAANPLDLPRSARFLCVKRCAAIDLVRGIALGEIRGFAAFTSIAHGCRLPPLVVQ